MLVAEIQHRPICYIFVLFYVIICVSDYVTACFIFRSETDLLSLLILLLFLLGQLFRKDYGYVVSNRIGMKFLRNIFK